MYIIFFQNSKIFNFLIRHIGIHNIQHGRGYLTAFKFTSTYGKCHTKKYLL